LPANQMRALASLAMLPKFERFLGDESRGCEPIKWEQRIRNGGDAYRALPGRTYYVVYRSGMVDPLSPCILTTMQGFGVAEHGTITKCSKLIFVSQRTKLARKVFSHYLNQPNPKISRHCVSAAVTHTVDCSELANV